MFTKFCSSFILIAFSFFMFQSCTTKEYENRNEYFIDNQSSFDLRYKIEIDDTLTDVNILSGNNAEIYSEVLRGGSFSPNGYFESISEYIGSDIYLTRDSLSVQIEALKLNADEDLDWIEKNSGSVVNFTLTVTDEMLN